MSGISEKKTLKVANICMSAVELFELNLVASQTATAENCFNC